MGKKTHAAMKNLNITIQPWPDYELLDSGGNRKLERYGRFVLARPETQAIWKISKPELWKKADAEFAWSEGKGRWERRKELPESWPLSWEDIRFEVRPTSFKHTGIFPEQAENWRWIKSGVGAIGKRGNSRPRVLNLFGYTGIASMAAAEGGALVTHLDASRQSNTWAKENARLTGIPADGIIFLLDDALKFAERELRRGASY